MNSSTILTTCCFALCVFAAQASAAHGFTDYGVGAKVAEVRNVVTTVTQDDRRLVIGNLTDEGPRGYVLLTDVDSGKTTQCFCPKGVPQVDPFGALMASNGRFYTTQGRWLLEFDPNAGEWTFHGKPSQRVSAYLSFTEGPDGMVWTGGAYKTALISFNPKTRKTKDHGVLDPKEHYLSHLAVDDAGWVYAGIGTARCNLVAYNPKTGEIRQLIDEKDRVHGSGYVHPSADGAVYGSAASKAYRLFDGKAERIRAMLPKRKVRSLKYGTRLFEFPDGCRVTAYDVETRTIKVLDPKTNQTKVIPFDFQTEGVSITSLGLGPDGIVYGSTCHPMHFLKFDSTAKTLVDMGAIPAVGGGNFCAIAAQGRTVIGAEYSDGRLWAFDVDKPFNPLGAKRKVLGIPAAQLVKEGRVDNGHFTYLRGEELAFLCGDKFGAVGRFKLTAPEAGDYYVHIVPYRFRSYCNVQFALDGKPLGKPYAAKSATAEVGKMIVHGPMALAAGEHWLSVEALPTKGQRPFFSVVTLALSKTKLGKLVEVEQGNPRVLAAWPRDICRPRTALAHPDGKHVMMAGFAGYGFCGGGIGIYNLETNKATLLTADRDLLPGHSCITLKALPNGDLVGGTSISAPGGGHTTATEAELFILDWKTKKITFHTVPVPRDGNIISIQVLADGLVYGLSGNSTFFVFDPKTKKIVHSESYAAYGGVPRHALQIAPDGKLYAMMSKAIVRIEPGAFKHEKVADAPVRISAGGALVNGQLVFASVSHVWTYDLAR